MSRHEKKRENSGATGVEIEGLKKSVGKVELALWGEDGCHGMVKDIMDIKASLRMASQVKSFALGIAATVIAGIVIAVVAGAL